MGSDTALAVDAAGTGRRWLLANWATYAEAMAEAVIVLSVVFLVLFTVVIMVWLGDRANRSRYASLQAGRPSLTDEEFCQRAGLHLHTAGLVQDVRIALARRGRGKYEAKRIYPEDEFCGPFDLTYDDDVAGFVEMADLVPGFHQYWFPLEEVSSVADFVRVVQRMKEEAGSS